MGRDPTSCSHNRDRNFTLCKLKVEMLDKSSSFARWLLNRFSITIDVADSLVTGLGPTFLLHAKKSVIFLSLFLLVFGRSSLPCQTEADCPDELYYFIECVNNFCVYWRDQ
ncbi:ubiquitin-protein ligase E3 Brl2 [Trifolium repens]|nr:ubiquitin-protein ligase E3 Brl2 [Trifolium repens]